VEWVGVQKSNLLLVRGNPYLRKREIRQWGTPVQNLGEVMHGHKKPREPALTLVVAYNYTKVKMKELMQTEEGVHRDVG